jgi:hypothetical protein
MKTKIVSSKTSKKFKLGDHICSIYQNKEQQFPQVIAFFKNGLENNHKCIYIADENTTEEVMAEFKKAGIKIEKYINSGQFSILTKNETYTRNGSFEPEKMIAFLKESEANTLKEGYSGFRVSGEMTWMLKNISDSKKLIEYESKLNDFLPNSKSAAICQYNENKFDQNILIDVIRTHPTLIIYGISYKNKYFYNSPYFIEGARGIFPPSSYSTIIDIIKEKK